MLETAAALACCCLPADGEKPARRSLACPRHGCTCGTGRATRLEHRGAVDGSCPTHGTGAQGNDSDRLPSPTVLHLPPLDPTALTAVDVAILANEKRSWKYQGAKEQECARIMGGSHYGAGTGPTVTRYFQRLNQLIDNPAALAAEPALIARLRAQREDH
ncbi:DUF3263 domain-containing protein [Kocuria sp. KH4]